MPNAIPDAPEYLEEALLDEKHMKTLMGPDGHIDPMKMSAFVDKYRTNALERDPDLGKQLKQAVKDGLNEAKDAWGLKTLPTGDVDPDAFNYSGPAVRNIYKPLGLTRNEARQIAANGRGAGAPFVGKFDSLGDWLNKTSHQYAAKHGLPAVYNDLNEAGASGEGFIVPEEFRAELLRLSLETAVVRPRARVIPMSTATLRMPVIRDTSHASTVFGGVSASWVAEAASLSSSTNQPTFGQVALVARKLTGYTVASNELLADSAISLEALVTSMFGDALAYFEDDSFIAGTGVGQPLGILNAAAMVSVAKETGQAATTLTYENLVKQYSRMLPQSLSRAVFYGHPDIFPQLAQMALNVGTGGSAVWISNAASGPPATIFGRPLILTEKAETLGAAGDLTFCDFGFYLIGDRMAMQMASSPHVNFTTDEMVWRFVQRVDGRPWLQSALTPRNGTNTLSPFVNIAVRA